MLLESPERQVVVLGAAAASTAALLWLARRRVGSGGAAPASGGKSFDDYLRNAAYGAQQAPTPQFAATSFDAYLRQPIAAAGAVQVAQQAEALAADVAPADAIPVTVLFGTEYGFSKEVAERACERLRAVQHPAPTSGGAGAAYWPSLLDMADLPAGLPGLQGHQALLVVCSTQGDGVPPTEAREFCDWLAGPGAPQLGGGLHFSVCALGDSSYQHFCRCGRTLDARLEALGGARLAPRVDVNREDWGAIDGWMDGVLACLAELQLETAAELGGFEAAPAAEGGAAAKRWNKARPYMGRVVALEGLCTVASASDKNTFRVELDLGDSGLQYAPGDALGVWPSNCLQAVDELLGVLGADGGVLVQLPSWHYADPLLPAGATSLPLRDALARCYDLRQPKLELLRLMHSKLSAAAPVGKPAAQEAVTEPVVQQAADAAAKLGRAQRGRSGDSAFELSMDVHGGLCASGCVVDELEHLAALLADVTAAEAYLAPRHVVDVLREFAGAAPGSGMAPLLGPAELLGTLRQLQPRLYSISSSQLEHPTRVQATVAVVRYASLGADRLGVCSTYLAERLAAGQQLPVYIHKNPDFRLPADDATPIIMVGPGTGLAPFRSFMQDRILRSRQTSQPYGQCLLYFGCRRRDQDFLYGHLLEGWAAEGKLQLHTAFSREQAHKVYVQDRLADTGRQVWDLLSAQGAHFYVCGDAGSMAGAVEAALLHIVEEGQGQGPEAARAFLDGLSQSGRYQRDVWLS